MTVWRDISLLWLIFLTLIAALPFGVIFYLATRGMRRLRQLAKQYLPLARTKAVEMADVTEKASQKVTKPFIEASARTAEINAILTTTFARRKNT
jgi:hypothetical protein